MANVKYHKKNNKWYTKDEDGNDVKIKDEATIDSLNEMESMMDDEDDDEPSNEGVIKVSEQPVPSNVKTEVGFIIGSKPIMENDYGYSCLVTVGFDDNSQVQLWLNNSDKEELNKNSENGETVSVAHYKVGDIVATSNNNQPTDKYSILEYKGNRYRKYVQEEVRIVDTGVSALTPEMYRKLKAEEALLEVKLNAEAKAKAKSFTTTLSALADNKDKMDSLGISMNLDASSLLGL